MAAPRDPEELEATAAAVASELPDRTRPGPVHLTVSHLARSLAYYEESIGLRADERDGRRAPLGTNATGLPVFAEQRGPPPAIGFTGLYHFGLLVPQRRDLAGWLAHAARDRVPLVGLSDHFVSEALYLSDPDGHGIEIYWDRPRQVWEGQVAERMTTLALDVDSLIAKLTDPRPDPSDGVPAATAI